MQSIAQMFQRRPEKSDVLTEPMLVMEQRIENIKVTYHSIFKKLQSLQHSTDSDKRSKKISELSLCRCLSDSAASLRDSSLSSDDSLSEMLQYCSEAQSSLVETLCQYENDIDAKILIPIQDLVEKDIPNIAKLRKHVTRLHQQLETDRAKLQTAQRQTISGGVTSQSLKVDLLRQEVVEAENKLNNSRDQLETDMFQFISRENELYRILLDLVEVQSTYYYNSYNSLQRLLPELRNKMTIGPRRPVYGCSLEEHLQHTRRPLSTVIESCCQALIQSGLQEEGLFRIAASTSKVKKLKAAFDADMVDWSDYRTDPHCITGALKQYLRELPVPLLTYELYQDWMQFTQYSAAEQPGYFASVLRKMPKQYFDNLRYLMQFLHALSANSDANKMTTNNLAIVMAPNLLWTPNADGPNYASTGALAMIVETLIVHTPQLFPGDDAIQTKNGIQITNKNRTNNGETSAQPVDRQIRDERNSVSGVNGTLVGVDTVDRQESRPSDVNQAVNHASPTPLINKRPNKRPPPPTPPITERYNPVLSGTDRSAQAGSSSVTTSVVQSASAAADSVQLSKQPLDASEVSGSHQAEGLRPGMVEESLEGNKNSRPSVETHVDEVTRNSSPESLHAEFSKSESHDSLPDIVKGGVVVRKAPAPPSEKPAAKLGSPNRITIADIPIATSTQKENTSHFSAKQALVSNILAKPRPTTVLTRPVQYGNEDMGPGHDNVSNVTTPTSIYASSGEIKAKEGSSDQEHVNTISNLTPVTKHPISLIVGQEESSSLKHQIVVVDVDINNPLEGDEKGVKPVRPSKPSRPASKMTPPGVTTDTSGVTVENRKEEKKDDADAESVTKQKPQATEIEKVSSTEQAVTDTKQKLVHRTDVQQLAVEDKKSVEMSAAAAFSDSNSAENQNASGQEKKASRPVKPPPPTNVRISSPTESKENEVKQEEAIDDEEESEDTKL